MQRLTSPAQPIRSQSPAHFLLQRHAIGLGWSPKLVSRVAAEPLGSRISQNTSLPFPQPVRLRDHAHYPEYLELSPRADRSHGVQVAEVGGEDGGDVFVRGVDALVAGCTQ